MLDRLRLLKTHPLTFRSGRTKARYIAWGMASRGRNTKIHKVGVEVEVHIEVEGGVSVEAEVGGGGAGGGGVGGGGGSNGN